MFRDVTHTHTKHWKERIECLENEKGAIEIGICNICKHIVRILCEHRKNTWKYTCNQENPEEQVLLCDLCGKDGT